MAYDTQKMRLYINTLRAKKRELAKQLLGGKCASCGSVEKLEIDHIDRKTKAGSVSGMYTSSKEKLDAELKKCQLLCKKCHDEKTKAEWAELTQHGKIGTYQHHRCRCTECVEANRFYHRNYKVRRKSNYVKNEAKKAD